MRCPDSIKTTVYSTADTSLKNFAFIFMRRKTHKDEFVRGEAEMLNAVTTADGPGMAITSATPNPLLVRGTRS